MTKKKDVSQETQSFDLARLYVWVKGLESKINNLLREVDMLKNDFMKKQDNIKSEVKSINSDLLDVKHLQGQTGQKINMIIKELKRTAGIEEVMTLKKYVDFWNPMNFVTQRDLERMIDNKLSSLNQKQNHKNSQNDVHDKDKEQNIIKPKI